MPSSYDRIILHGVWSTKYREPWIVEAIQDELYAVMVAEFKKHGCNVIQIGGVEDHVHVIYTLSRTKTVAEIMSSVKGVSSTWLSRRAAQYAGFEWQTGYSVFSVDYRKLDGLIYYVSHQRERHGPKAKNNSFQYEHTKLLVDHGHEDFTPEYVFPNRPESNQ